jgi:DNA-binding CsgD family transcriptional regulator
LKRGTNRFLLQGSNPPDLSRIASLYNLTRREREIIHLVIAGKTSKEIEEALFTSLKTDKSHLSNIYRKLKVKNRLQLMNVIQNNNPNGSS